MHMSDALISPAVGLAGWGVSTAAIAIASASLKKEPEKIPVPLMGMMAAFVFAAQMVNFSIPGTGSSGHLVGTILLAALLGPRVAFLAIASVVTVQALFFADGGLLALGCNIFNMGAVPALLVYPLLFKPALAFKGSSKMNTSPLTLTLLTVLASIVSLEIGALFVVLETTASGITQLPFATFIMAMLPIHFVISIIEGLVSAALLLFLFRMEPGLSLYTVQTKGRADEPSISKRGLIVIGVVTLLTAAVLALFASSHPDGLEWSLAKVTGTEDEFKTESSQTEKLYLLSENIQHKLSVFAEYHLPDGLFAPKPNAEQAVGEEEPGALSSATAGIIGTLMTLLLTGAISFLLLKRKKQV